ncbi:YccF domain-containing protein [Fusibacter sp. JL298sf-3]
MSLLGNLIWILLGGLIGAIGWTIAGVLLCITVIGIPFGMQCFKIAGLTLTPFGREVEIGHFGAGGLLGNILWLIFLGWELCLFHLGVGLLLCVTIVGIPFGMQHFKLAQLALLPFGSRF